MCVFAFQSCLRVKIVHSASCPALTAQYSFVFICPDVFQICFSVEFSSPRPDSAAFLPLEIPQAVFPHSFQFFVASSAAWRLGI